jgi:hypothetical protein
VARRHAPPDLHAPRLLGTLGRDHAVRAVGDLRRDTSGDRVIGSCPSPVVLSVAACRIEAAARVRHDSTDYACDRARRDMGLALPGRIR